MISMTLREIAEVVQGQLCHVDPETITSQYPVIDSRQVTAQTFFVAIKGAHSDGHDFARSAIDSGAQFILATQEIDLPSIVVENCELALTRLASFVREKLVNTRVIALTGSQGKTTTKDISKYIFELMGETVATEASFNNELGLPLTLLRATPNTKYLILEMGARHIGDIANLCTVAKPDIGAVLVVGNAHQEIFGSQEAIAKAKSELITSLNSDGVAVLGCFDPFTPRMADGRGIKTIKFGVESSEDELDVRAADIELRDGKPHFDLVTSVGRESISLNYFGEHQVANALAAAAIALAAEIPFDRICEGLSMAMPTSQLRMQVEEVGGVLIINDSYNANPASMKAAISTLRHFAQAHGGESWAFLGKMHELGNQELGFHGEIGRQLTLDVIDHLVEIGFCGYAEGVRASKSTSTQIHEAMDSAEAMLMVPRIQPGDCILIKASRAESLDLFAARLKMELQGRGTENSEVNGLTLTEIEHNNEEQIS